jgi:hypothetical protein
MLPDPEDAAKAVITILDAGATYISIKLTETDKSGWKKTLTIDVHQGVSNETAGKFDKGFRTTNTCP